MSRRCFWYLLALFWAAGCAPAPLDAPLTDRDPQSPTAPEAPLARRSTTLDLAPAALPTTMKAGAGDLMPDMSGPPRTRPDTQPGEAAALSASRPSPDTSPSTAPIDSSIAAPLTTQPAGGRQ